MHLQMCWSTVRCVARLVSATLGGLPTAGLRSPTPIPIFVEILLLWFAMVSWRTTRRCAVNNTMRDCFLHRKPIRRSWFTRFISMSRQGWASWMLFEKHCKNLKAVLLLALCTRKNRDGWSSPARARRFLSGLAQRGFLSLLISLPYCRSRREYQVLENGDVADLREDSCTITNRKGETVERPMLHSHQSGDAADRGEYRHFMQKEIHEQTAGSGRHS